MKVFLAHITVKAPDGRVRTLFFSNKPVRPFRANDADAPNRVYDPRLIEPANIRRDLFGDVTRGGGETGYGIMKLSNADGQISYLRDHIFSDVRIYRATEGQAFAAAQEIFTGSVSSPTWVHTARTAASLILHINSALKLLDRNLQSALYTGSGRDEGPEELKGQPKPVTLGDLSTGNVPGTFIEAANQVWQLHEKRLAKIDAVFDRGAPAGYTSEGDLSGSTFDTARPDPVHYVTDLGRGLIKLGGNPVGNVSFSVTETAQATPAKLIKKLLLRAGVSRVNIGKSFERAVGPVVGFHATHNLGLNDAVHYMARAEFAAVSPGITGQWTYIPLTIPGAPAAAAIEWDDIIDLTGDDTTDGPVWSIRVGYDKNHAPMRRNAIAPSIHNTAREAYLENGFRYAVAKSEQTASDYPNARELTLDTPIRYESDAQALAGNILDILGPRAGGGVRERLRIVMQMTDERLQIELGSAIHLNYPPADIDDIYLLVGIEMTRPKPEQMIWRVWG